MKKFKKTLNSENEMEKFGEEFAKNLTSGDRVFLYGDLGVGKTTFTKGLAKGLKIPSRIISPTFVLIRKHVSSGLNFYHIDLYRIEGKEKIQNIGLPEILDDPNGIAVVEWADRLEGEKPKNRWEIKFKNVGENERNVEVEEYE